MNVGVCYAVADKQLWLNLEVSEGCSIGEIIDQSGILQQYPEIDLTKQKVGVFGKLTKLNAKVREGDRIEIYRDLIADPKQTRRRKT